jgi:hypothetical protein
VIAVSFGAGTALIDPLSHLLGKFGMAQWRLRAAVAGVPAPEHQLVLGDVMDQLLDCLAPVLSWVFQLPAKITR